MKTGWIVCALLGSAALPCRTDAQAVQAPIAGTGLVADKDTVAGIQGPSWDPRVPWVPAEFIRIRNVSTRYLILDSLRIPDDSLSYPSATYASPLEIAFAARIYGPMPAILKYVRKYPGWSLNPDRIVLAPGDSVDLGLFAIGEIGILAKASASMRRYLPGDSILAPFTFFASGDSVRFFVKGKTGVFTDETSGISFWDRKRQVKTENGAVTADGRGVRDARPAALVRFGNPFKAAPSPAAGAHRDPAR